MTAATCPECGGGRIPRHPAGLVFDHGQRCGLLAAEDSLRIADYDAVAGGGWDPRRTREHERVLLRACGAGDDQIPDRTIVTEITDGGAVVRRTWVGAVTGDPLDPDLLDPEPTTEDA